MTKLSRIKTPLFILCAVGFMSLYARIGFAVGSYYLDSMKHDRAHMEQSYSQSEVYADANTSTHNSSNSVSAESNVIYTDATQKPQGYTTTNGSFNIYQDSSTTTNGNAKKIYNTIIIKKNDTKQGNKNVVNKNIRRIKKIRTEQTEETDQPKTTKKYVNEDYSHKNLRPEERARIDNDRIEENKKKLEKKKKQELEEEEYKSYTKKRYDDEGWISKPASWYIYGFGGYSLAMPLFSRFHSSLNGVALPTTDFPFSHGFHFGAGAKVYSWYFFAAPELSYQRFSTTLYNKTDEVQVTKYRSFGTNNWVADGEISANEEKKVQLKDMIIGGLRLGFTFGTTLSIYARGNLGMINMYSSVNYSLSQTTMNGLSDLEKDSVLIQVKRNNKNLNNWCFVYGFGAGLEVSMWRQHIFFRLEYNYYWMSATHIMTLQTLKEGEENSRLGYKANFGVASLSAGFAF